MGVLSRLRDQGKIRHIGLSEVSIEEIEWARTVVEISTVQNRFNLANCKYEDVLAFCERNGIAFISFYPQKLGTLGETEAIRTIAARKGVTPTLVALAWLLKRSPAMAILPGTSSLAHLEENAGAASVELSFDDMALLDGLTKTSGQAA